MKKKAKIINFDDEVLDGKSVLQAYRAILNEEWVEPVYRGKRANLSDVLRSENYPELGFNNGVLPGHIDNVSIDEREGGKIALSYAGKLNHCLEKSYWENRGFSTRRVKKSMQVVDDVGNIIATYGLKRILIERERLDQFIENMRE